MQLLIEIRDFIQCMLSGQVLFNLRVLLVGFELNGILYFLYFFHINM